MTSVFGSNLNFGGGTIFKITADGDFANLYDFCADGNQKNGCMDGWRPETLVQATNGNFYGTGGSWLRSNGHGINSTGEDFKFSVGLGPFVETLPTSSTVGSAIKIRGTDLTGATSVSFNGMPSTFTTDSKSLITATVARRCN